MLALAAALGMGAFEASFARPPAAKAVASLASFRANWKPELQGEPSRDVALVRRLQASKRTRDEWVAWVNGQTLLGRPRPLPPSAGAAFAGQPDEPDHVSSPTEPELEPEVVDEGRVDAARDVVGIDREIDPR
jgi:hypothetical protein